MRTTADIENELVRVTKWRTDRGFLVASPDVDLAMLAEDPGGLYADRIMSMLRTNYPQANAQ